MYVLKSISKIPKFLQKPFWIRHWGPLTYEVDLNDQSQQQARVDHIKSWTVVDHSNDPEPHLVTPPNKSPKLTLDVAVAPFLVPTSEFSDLDSEHSNQQYIHSTRPKYSLCLSNVIFTLQAIVVV